jgi:hypothetical protein
VVKIVREKWRVKHILALSRIVPLEILRDVDDLYVEVHDFWKKEKWVDLHTQCHNIALRLEHYAKLFRAHGEKQWPGT